MQIALLSPGLLREQGTLRHPTAVDTDDFGHAAASLVFITNPGIHLLLAAGTQPRKSDKLGLDAALQSKYPSSLPTLEGRFFALIGSSRVSSLPMAPHTVKHQDNGTQAVAGSMWRAEDSAERSRFVLPSGYLKRQQKTKRVVGGAWARSQVCDSHHRGSTPGDTPSEWLCARSKWRPLMGHGLNHI